MSSIQERIIAEYGGEYDLSVVDFRGTKTKIVFICPDHGPFYTSPDNLIYNAGCPKCRGVHPRGYPKRRVNPRVKRKQAPGPKPPVHSFYIHDVGSGSFLKIGITRKSVEYRRARIVYFKEFDSIKICRSVERLIKSLYVMDVAPEGSVYNGSPQITYYKHLNEIINIVDSVPASCK